MQQHLGSKRTISDRLTCQDPSDADNDGDEILCPVSKLSLSVGEVSDHVCGGDLIWCRQCHQGFLERVEYEDHTHAHSLDEEFKKESGASIAQSKEEYKQDDKGGWDKLGAPVATQTEQPTQPATSSSSLFGYPR